MEDKKCAEYISPARSFGKLSGGAREDKRCSGRSVRENKEPQASSKGRFGHKKCSQDSPFGSITKYDQEVPLNLEDSGEVDYYYSVQSPAITEEIFHEALKKNMLKNKQMEHEQQTSQRGCPSDDLMHAARQNSQEPLPFANEGHENSKGKTFGHTKFYGNPFAGISENTKRASKKRIWFVNDLQPSKSLVDKARCFVSHRWTNSKFTLSAVVDANKLEALQDSLYKYCLTAPPVDRIPMIGEILFLSFEGKYYRCKVDAVKAFTLDVALTFIDHGASVRTNVSNCLEPCANIMKSHPVYGIVFESFLEEADSKVELPPEVTKKLDVEVVIEIETMSKTEWTGIMYVDGGALRWDHILKEIYSIDNGDITVDNGYIMEVEVANRPVTNMRVHSQIPGNKFAPFESDEDLETSFFEVGEARKPVTMNPFTRNAHPVPNKRTIYNFKISPNLYDGAIVSVNFRCHYRKLNISAREDDDGIESLTSSIENYVKTAATMIRKPDVDEVVLAPYEGSYYRAVVKEVKDRIVHVEFLDCGDEARVLFWELISLSEEIIEHPIYSINLITTDLPEGLPFVNSPVLDEALVEGGFVDVKNMTRLVWEGDLLLRGRRISWSELVLDFLKANNFNHCQ